MSILVTGGAGYIGSHTVAELLAHGEEVIVIDNLQTGHQQAVLTDIFYQGDICNSSFLDKVFSTHPIEAVIHFAADSLVGESVQDPLKYYHNNVITAHSLLVKMIEYKVKNLVFSSTAAVYGEPGQIPIKETERTAPASPYGETKLAIEKMLYWCDQAYELRSISLRYFNAAGAHPELPIGEHHDPESHLIPLILQVALGQRETISIFGADYPTADGTCIRDYIHVQDLAQAHWLALQKLRTSSATSIYNLGNGLGFSVRQVIEKAREVTGHPIPSEIAPRRSGDPAILIASAEKAKIELGWQPTSSTLDTIIHSAWKWHKNHPHRFYR